jgi:Protein of unknown function (DUF1397)
MQEFDFGQIQISTRSRYRPDPDPLNQIQIQVLIIFFCYRCLAIGGEKVLRAWQKEQENLIHCFMQEFDFDQIQAEIQEKKKTGELDEVFKNYCG